MEEKYSTKTFFNTQKNKDIFRCVNYKTAADAIRLIKIKNRLKQREIRRMAQHVYLWGNHR